MTLDIAIIGGGVGGLTAAIALRQHPALRVQIYEQASSFREIGAVVGLAPNGLRTLEKLSVDDVLTDAVGWRNPSGIPMIFRHWQTGEILSTDQYHNVQDRRHHFARVHRAKLQKALLKKLPADILHLSKRVVSVIADDEKVTVSFEDGTSITPDLVVGADGIKSRVRKAFVTNHELSWTGEAIFRSTFPYSLVSDIKDLPQDSIHWTGPTAWLFGTRIGNDEYAITASFPINQLDPTAPFQDIVWNAPADPEILHEAFKDFHPTPRAIIAIIPHLRRYANIAGAALPHWSFAAARVVLLGDAAHTHGGAFAAGASLAIDDAYALFLALRATIPVVPLTTPTAEESVVTREQISLALGLYEATRRPQADRVLRTVHQGHGEARKRLEGVWRTGVGEGDGAFRARFKEREDPVWLTEHDVEAAFEGVLGKVQEGARGRGARGAGGDGVVVEAKL
ncbi:salicylate hydroxylase [Mytilinidion resinicola]|uniref:Salicylate hydroxylase n=1 Tax=Mytilinidion resinicola TaxID=574789 RepID=A0A6A6Y0T6_9PEZI|nr:salicylate hydroxylase [Mytilinidion resinicola]KAF2802259.1 salicylate hydroxylase [Mytilinidion resinicola]